MASGLTPWLALEIPDDPADITPEMLEAWKKKQKLARLAAMGCNVIFEEIGLRHRMNFYFEFKKSSEWKNLGYLKTVRMGKEILKKDVSKLVKKKKKKLEVLTWGYSGQNLMAMMCFTGPSMRSKIPPELTTSKSR